MKRKSFLLSFSGFVGNDKEREREREREKELFSVSSCKKQTNENVPSLFFLIHDQCSCRVERIFFFFLVQARMKGRKRKRKRKKKSTSRPLPPSRSIAPSLPSNEPPYPLPRPRDPHGPLCSALLGAVPRQHAPRPSRRPFLGRRRRRSRRGRGFRDGPEALVCVPPGGARDLDGGGAGAVVGQRGEELEDCVWGMVLELAGGESGGRLRERKKEVERESVGGGGRVVGRIHKLRFRTHGSALRALLSRVA